MEQEQLGWFSVIPAEVQQMIIHYLEKDIASLGALAQTSSGMQALCGDNIKNVFYQKLVFDDDDKLLCDQWFKAHNGMDTTWRTMCMIVASKRGTNKFPACVALALWDGASTKASKTGERKGFFSSLKSLLTTKPLVEMALLGAPGAGKSAFLKFVKYTVVASLPRRHPPNLSISLSGGRETNRDSLSSGERAGRSPSSKSRWPYVSL
eukprot:TRINITY_DN4501_c0_g1_i1.p1 TRINITY_DN4501_c0_g1~~TRINITY_DN4501_c0_g1_i1.p1  ORF type:complete len:208 (-),score=25.59 TRINITY_DN4501_c0_g1_i1:14-637(-)